MTWADFLEATPTYASLLAALVTAVATIFLWKVTAVLAVHTKRMADASAQPHVVATLGPGRWSINHFDLKVENTGNATAYKIEVRFDPPLPDTRKHQPSKVPLQSISVLKPGQGMHSFLTDYATVEGQSFSVEVSWQRHPSQDDRESISYVLHMSHLEGISHLGGDDPLIRIAQDLRKLQEDLSSLTRGSGRLRADVFTARDRDREREEIEAWYREVEVQQQAAEAGKVKDQPDP